MEQYETLRAELIRMLKQYPNDMDFGREVRALVWQMMEKRSQLLKDEQLPGQMDIYDIINEKNNGRTK